MRGFEPLLSHLLPLTFYCGFAAPMSTVIKVENLSKRYRLGVINRDMLYKDQQSRWARFRGKEDPNATSGS